MLANAPAILREIDAGTGERELRHHAISTIACPVVWLIGDRSAKSFPAAARRAGWEQAMITRRSVERSGHALQHDRPDAVVDAIHFAEARTPV
jgi:pimeloyl-ACP methyl ester carboxylesterase